MSENYLDLNDFESIRWAESAEASEFAETPAITPGLLSNTVGVNKDGTPHFEGIVHGVHWNSSSYPAWTGKQPFRQAAEEQLPSTPSALFSNKDFEKTQRCEAQHAAPFEINHIVAMVNQVCEVFGFQRDAAINVFELLMSQLDSRSSRSGPRTALNSLHADYISGTQSNFRKWYFAAHMDQIDHEQDNIPSTSGIEKAMEEILCEDEDEEDFSLEVAEGVWNYHYKTCPPEEKLVDLLIYLFCWTEANQVRFMPECLAFIVKCARDYYYARFPTHPQYSRNTADLEQFYFLDKVITPIYDCYCRHNFIRTDSGALIRREGDHKDFIGYDDMNQLFWYRQGLRKLKVGDSVLVDLPREDWFVNLTDVSWDRCFSKTYREMRSWLHNITNFSRIWILHTSVFWFYTAFNSPSLYTLGYNYMNPEPPKQFVRWTIVSFGGLFGPTITLLGLLGELIFVPRKYPGAKPILTRLSAVVLFIVLLAVPAICNLTLNPWTGDDIDMMPADTIAFVCFALAIVYTLYFSFQPLDAVFTATKLGLTSKESDCIRRRFLASKLFTASFPQRNRSEELVSWLMCLLIFVAKFTESYFFLTLSIRDPIRELGIMDLGDRCVDDSYLFGKAFCRWYPRVILAGVILTDMILFFLDTYLWYVILSTLVSVSIALKQGISIWTPWRNIYSQLSQRISTKLLAPSTNERMYDSRAYSVRVVWNSIVDSMYRNNLLSRDQATRLIYVNSMTQEPRFFTMEEDGKALENSSGYRSSGAYRRISFFAQSLSTTMQPAVSVDEMPSFTVLIPHYKEKMVLGLSETIKAESGAKITVLEYLQRLYPQEWNNFVQALNRQTGADNMTENLSFTPSPNSIKSPGSASSFTSSKSNGKCTSNRAGMASQGSILKPTPKFESPVAMSSASSIRSQRSHQLAIQRLGFSTLDPSETDKTRLWCSERTQTLYRTVRGFSNYTNALKVLQCAEQVSDSPGSLRTERVVRDVTKLCQRKFRLLVAMQMYSSFSPQQLSEVETIMAYVPELVVSYFEERDGVFYSCVFDASCPLLESGRRKPKMCLRLSGNPILGDGKSDNQNTALQFFRGEYIQLVDANQDNYLEECLKIRNVLREFEVSSGTVAPASFSDLEAQESFEYTLLNPAPAPVAILGAREYIFSENMGVLGDVAAGKEQTFGTLFSRTLAKIGAKLHYGHPDFLNAVFMTTRGGVSKGQRGLHLNEDIYAGLTAVQRGGHIRHCEYFQCGKGRDLGFASILNFTAKIGAGMGEQMLSREYFYMGSQLPFDRFIAFYYAHPGFHINNACIMLSLEMLLMVILWLSSIAQVSTVCNYDHSLHATAPHRPAGCTNVLVLVDWIARCVVSIFVVFFVSLCPLLFQELTEKGFFKCLGRMVRHLGSLSMLFEVFVCRIYARSFWEDMNLGGAKYVATGRGLATTRLAFHMLYKGYHPEIVTGLKIAAILIISGVVVWNPCYLWFWATAFSLCFCPVLFNPHQFAFTEFFLDYQKLVLWFWNATSVRSSPSDTNSWGAFNRETRGKLTGVKNRHENSESTRPALRNAVLSEVGVAMLNVFCFGMPYLYIGIQETSRFRSSPGKRVLLRVVLVSLIPIAMNMLVLVLGLFASMVFRLITGTSKHANTMAMVVHTTSLIGLIVSYWVLCILECRRFTATLLGVMVIASVHHFIHTLLAVLIIRRQRDRAKTNDPWWVGRWQYRNWSELLCLPLVIAEEYLVKIVETLQYAYDFLVCHLVLAPQLPLLLTPCVDKLHTLFLLWLKPCFTKAAARSISVQRKRRDVLKSRIFCGVFVGVAGTLALLLAFPFYMPQAWAEPAGEFLLGVADW